MDPHNGFYAKLVFWRMEGGLCVEFQLGQELGSACSNTWSVKPLNTTRYQDRIEEAFCHKAENELGLK